MASDEEARATEYRRMMAARDSFVRSRERQLAGSPSARLRVADAWRPLTDPQPAAIEPLQSDMTNAG